MAGDLHPTPAETTLLSVVEALEPESLGQHLDTAGDSGAAVSKTWEEVRQISRKILEKHTLDSMAASAEPMFYI